MVRHRPTLSKIVAPLLMLTLVAGACSRHANDYSAFSTLPSQGWKYGSTLLYMPVTEDSIVCGTLSLIVRHSNLYPYRNLYLEVTSQQPSKGGQIEYRTDTLNIMLANELGEWLGHGSGVSFQRADTLSTHFTLLSGAPLRVRHIMRDPLVEGLEQIGFTFTANNQ